MKISCAFKVSDGNLVCGPEYRHTITDFFKANFKEIAELACGEPAIVYVCDESEAPTGAGPWFATIASGVIINVSRLLELKQVDIGLTLGGTLVTSGWISIVQGSAATVYLKVSVDDTDINGDYTVPVQTPIKRLPITLTFTDGAASHNISTSAEKGEYSMTADLVKMYLNRLYKNKAWEVSGGAYIAIS